MSGPLRSKQGCWTCRLRKKKCDENRPQCSTCDSLSITCYGFGPKPGWMDNGEKEKVVANEIKEMVKQNLRRKEPAQPKQRVRIAPKSLNGTAEKSSFDPGSSDQLTVSPPDDQSSRADGSSMEVTSLPGNNNHLMTRPMYSIPSDESVLMAHFLDVVFPLQYPMYKPGILEGGRGWLMALLLRSKPFYHAALGLSAYAHRMTLLNQTCNSNQAISSLQQEKHLQISLQLVNQFAQGSCLRMGLDFTIVVVQLMFYELFTGQDNTWQAHLRAAINMYRRGCGEDLIPFGLTDKARMILLNDIPLETNEPAVVEEAVSYRFLASTIIWLDITSSISTGTASNSLPHYLSLLGSGSQIKLEHVMGCNNQVMLQIGRISAIQGQKAQASQLEQFDCTELGHIVLDITREIQLQLIETRQHTEPSSLITRVFALMASIYLHLVLHGFQELEAFDPTISEAMEMLQSQVPVHLLPALISPLYVIGSVARPGDEQYFRDVLSCETFMDPILQHRRKILPALEQIWNRRRTTLEFTWTDSLELVSGILLV